MQASGKMVLYSMTNLFPSRHTPPVAFPSLALQTDSELPLDGSSHRRSDTEFAVCRSWSTLLTSVIELIELCEGEGTKVSRKNHPLIVR
jgi:hypothetical protein